MQKFLNNHQGALIVELLIAIALASLVIPAILTGLVSSREGKVQQEQRLQAVPLLRETVEAVKSVRQNNWTTFAVNGTYHPEVNNGKWTLATGSATVNSFGQQVVISDVLRDSTSKIVTSGGTVDPSTKKIVATVSWSQPYNSSVDSTLYLSRYRDNLSFTETTLTDFNAGTKSATVVSATNGSPTDGQVQLGAGNYGDWCQPAVYIVTRLGLSKLGVPKALTSKEGRALVGTGKDSSGLSLIDLNIDNANPPVVSIIGTLDGYKTNDIFLDPIGNYAYIATNSNSKEVVIIDLNTHQEVGFFNSKGDGNGIGVYVSGNVGYILSSHFLYNFDLSSKTGSRPVLDSNGIDLKANGNSIVIKGNYAYVSTTDSKKQLQIIDITNASALKLVSTTDVGSKGGKDLFVNDTGTRVYLVTKNESGKDNFFIVDTTLKTNNRPIVGSYNTHPMNPNEVVVVPGNRAIIGGIDGDEYQVLDISNESTPTQCGKVNLDQGIQALSSVLESDGDAYSYVVTNKDPKSDFVIIRGGNGGLYSSSGTFESKTFDANYSTSFNRFSANINQPANTTLGLQVATAPQVNNSCTGVTYTFIGPDEANRTGSYFTYSGIGTASISAAIPFINNVGNYKNPGRCFRYKGFFNSTDPSSTPILYDLSVNYSP